MLQLTDTIPAVYFKDNGNGQWKCSNGFIVGGAILDQYRKDNGALRLPLSNEIYGGEPGHPFSIQKYEGGFYVYDPDHKFDNPPGSPQIYVAHIDNPVCIQMMDLHQASDYNQLSSHANDLQNALNSANTQIGTLKSQLAAEAQTALQTEITSLQDKLKQIATIAQG